MILPNKSTWNITVSRLNLRNNAIRFNDDNAPVQPHGLDYSHLAATNVSLSADNFSMSPDSVAVIISKGTADEKSGLKLEQLRGDILYANDEAYLRNFYIKTPGTELQKDIELKYPSIEEFINHPEKGHVKIDLAKSKVQVKDILLFAPQLRSNLALKNPNDVWTVNVIGDGTLNQFNFQALEFAGLSNTQLDAHGSLRGLTDLKNAGGDFIIDRLHTNKNDIALLTGQSLSNQQMDLPEDITMHGTLKGNSGILNANLDILTPDGSVAVNGRFRDLANPKLTHYNGVINAKDLNLGKILMQPNTMGSLTASVSVNGKGLTTDAVDAKFSTSIASAELNQYRYQNININGSIYKTNFDVKANIDDPNADANFSISGNFSDHPAFSIDGMIDSLKAMPLHLTAQPLIVRGKIKGRASDLTAENITADILITQALFVSGSNRLPLDTIQLLSGKNDTANYIRLKSDLVNANITGQYKLVELGSNIQNSIQPYFNTVSAPSKENTAPYNVNFSVDVMYDPILSAFVPGLTDMHPLHLSGNISNNNLYAVLKAPYIVYQGSSISDLNVHANSATNGLQVTASVSRLQSGSSFDIYNTQLSALAQNNNIDFRLAVDDENKKQKYLIAGQVTQPTTGTYQIQLQPDSLRLNYQQWTVTPNNVIKILPDNIIADNFVLESGNQRLSIASPVSRGQQLLLINFSNFQLATITGFLKADSVLATGAINGDVRVSNFLKEFNFTSDLSITDLSIRNDTVGNVTLHVANGGPNKYSTELNITGLGNDAALTGSFSTGKTIDLNLELNIRALQLHTLEGAMAGAIDNAAGAINGNVSVRGSLDKPDLNGSLNFDKASFVIAPLGSQFHLSDQKLSVANDAFTFNDFTIKDSSGNSLAFNGAVSTTNFINYKFNLKVTARKFQVLNSTKKQNSIYYGKMNISTNISITGTEAKPVVDGRISVNDGTAVTFVVPQPEAGVETRDGIVEFVDMSNPASDTLFRQYDSLNTSAITGMDIALNIHVNKEAVFNIIIDAANGDFLNTQGEAELSAGIDPSGKVTLTGNYTLEKGYYQLSFNFLKRKFEIEKGSVITWTGEPTTAKLDVKAMYIANTAPIDLVQDQLEGSPAAIKNTFMQKLPFEVHLNLTGELMKPQVAFSIVLPENKNYGVANDVVTTVQYKLLQLRQDQGETNKQVFSLLLLNRFVGENPFKSAGGGFNAGTYVRQSASRLLTSELNSLAEGLVNGVDVNFDVTSTEDYTTGSMRNKTNWILM